MKRVKRSAVDDSTSKMDPTGREDSVQPRLEKENVYVGRTTENSPGRIHTRAQRNRLRKHLAYVISSPEYLTVAQR